MLLFILLFVFLGRNSCTLDSITRNQSLSGDEKLMSEGGQFVLGFFKPGNSSYYYIGIWYKNIPQLTPIWVANRNTPVNDPRKNRLIISNNGNIVLVNDSNFPQVWSTNITSSAANYAVLLDTGNFVLRDNQNTTTTLWQSFDHQTNTWLPGSKLGVNKVNGNNIQHLISWKSPDDPSYGSYSLSIDPKGSKQFLITWDNSINYWSSGIWNGEIFANVPEMVAHYLYNFEYVSNDEEDYFTYSLQTGESLISRFIIDISGQIKQLTWVEEMKQWSLFWAQPKRQCQVYALCGPFASCNEDSYPSYCNCIQGFRRKSVSDMGRGCVRNHPLQSGKNSSDWFLAMHNMKMPDAAISLKLLNITTSSVCERACLNNSSCNAYSYGISTGCSMWCSSLLNLQEQYTDPNSGTLCIRLAASEFGTNSVKSLKSGNAFTKVKVGATVGGVIVLLLTVSITMNFWMRKKSRERSSHPKVGEGGLVAFRYSYLQKVTKNFSDKIGEGGFGSVFKGILPADSTPVAIKKLQGLRQGEKQFRAEVSTIGTIQHVNLVRLHGFCSEGQNRLLVYEYMPNGSLQTQLFKKGANSNVIINWDTRYQIALGIARGLTYLHNHCRDCIIHCDIKPENILLDASFVPKVADFGLAKLLGRDLSRVLTTMRGTMGYLAPEWISGLPITPKADVYSYGMMLFEIISGRRNIQMSTDEDDEPHFFPAMAATKLMEGEVTGLLDERLQGIAKIEEVIRICKVACWCIQDDERCRPPMLEVLQILERVVQVNMPPIPKVLHIFANNNDISTPNFFSELSTEASVHSHIPSFSSKD